MPNLLVAGNSTNGGTSITTDTSGTLNIVTGSGSGANAITIDASQNVTFANAISVAGSTTVTGALSVTGTITASGGVSGSITSGTAVSASGTSVTFTGIPSTAKRITVMMTGVSSNGTSPFQIQIGAGSVETTGYSSGSSQSLSIVSPATSTSGFIVVYGGVAANLLSGQFVLTLLGSNIWVQQGVGFYTDRNVTSGGNKTLSGALDRVRITTVNGTDTFDAGSINILYE